MTGTHDALRSTAEEIVDEIDEAVSEAVDFGGGVYWGLLHGDVYDEVERQLGGL